MRLNVCVSLLAVLVVCPSAGGPARAADELEVIPPGTFALEAEEPSRNEPNADGRILVREIMRQAFLLSARDEMGLATRDMTLRETMPADGEIALRPLKISTTNSLGKSVSVQVAQSIDGVIRFPFKKRIDLPMASPELYDYSGLVAAAEDLSRTAMPKALEKMGFRGQPLPWVATLAIEESTSTRLSEMNFISQFEALRELHALEKQKGESPQTLGALARAYANLSQLTRFHWNAVHKAFMARSLLYAQRLVVRDNGSAWSLRHRAYTEAMAGLHVSALKDLQAARELKTPDEPPAWEPIIDAYCCYDSKAAGGETPADVRELAALVSYLIVENSDSENLTLTAGRRTLEAVPECYAVCDSMARFSGVSNRHRVTVEGPQMMSQTMAGRLQGMTGIPATVDAELSRIIQSAPNEDADPAWAAGAGRAALVKSLVEAGVAKNDHQEPSWEVLGRLIEDVSFVHVYRRLEFFADGLGLPVEHFAPQLDAAIAPVADHPYVPMLRCMTLHSRRDGKKIIELCKNLKVVDAELSVYPFARRAWWAGHEQSTVGQIIWIRIQQHGDGTVQDLEEFSNMLKNPKLPHALQAVSPRSPQAVARLIGNDLKYAQPRMAQWETEFASHPNVQKALATRYEQLGQARDSERCLQNYIKLSPDQWGFETLANLYRQQKQPEKMKATLEESLKHEDFALSHAKSRVAIARYHMERKEWQQAKEYADAAAETGAAWALRCAADCYEGLEDWDRANQLWRVNAERYSNQPMDWYLWCRRTGHGDTETAQQLAAVQAAQLAESATPGDGELAGIYYLLAGDHAAAKAAFQKSFDKSGNPYTGIHLALTLDALADATARDVAVAEAVDRGEKFRLTNGRPTPLEVSVAQWLNSANHQPPESEPPLAELEEILKTPGKGDQANVLYFAGRYCQIHGKPELARQFWQRCVDIEEAKTKWNYVLAISQLHDLPAKQAEAEKQQ